MSQQDIKFTLNGVPTRVTVPVDMSALKMMRDVIGLTGTKYGCGEGECGACTILVDGVSVNSCLLFAVECDGREVTTIEGLASDPLGLRIEKAFVEAGAVQCGFCTPGMVVQAKQLLEDNPHPTREEIKRGIEGNLCRCTGYVKIIDAIEAAAGGKGVLTCRETIQSRLAHRQAHHQARCAGKGQRQDALHPGPRPAGAALRQDPALQPGACADQAHRHLEGEGAARRACGDHRRRRPLPAPDRRRQGPLPAEDRPGAQPARRDRRGGGRDRGHRRSGAEADRGRVRGSADPHRPERRAQAGRAADPPGAARRRRQPRASQAGHAHRLRRQAGQRRHDLRLRPGRRGGGRARVRRGVRGHLLPALRHALLHGRLGHHRRVRFLREPAAVLEHPGALPAQARVRRDPQHGPGTHPHHPAAHRRRLRLQAGHLSLRADLRLPGQGHRPAGQAGVHARGGIHRLADAPAGDPHAALGLQEGRHADLPHRATPCTTTAPTPRGARPRPS